MAAAVFLYLCSLFFTFFQGQLVQLHLQHSLDEIAGKVAMWSYSMAFAERYAGRPLTVLSEQGLLDEALGGEAGAAERLFSEDGDAAGEIGRFLLDRGSAVLWQAGIRDWLIRQIGDRFPGSAALAEGTAGLSLSGSSLHDRSLDLILTYRISSAVRFPLSLSYTVVQRSCRHLWIGDEGFLSADGEAEPEEARVYVTGEGTVYHLSEYCRILDIHPEAVPTAALPALRNTSGGRYYPCETCLKGGTVSGGTVYVTASGSRYHAGSECSRIRRDIRAIPLSEAQERYRLCFYCGNMGDDP